MSLDNIGSITKIEIALADSIPSFKKPVTESIPVWEKMPVTPLSATFDSKATPNKHGIRYKSKLTFLMPKIGTEKSALIDKYERKPVAWRITDANGTVFIVGDNSEWGYLLTGIALPQAPAGYNGYGIASTCNSTSKINFVL